MNTDNPYKPYSLKKTTQTRPSLECSVVAVALSFSLLLGAMPARADHDSHKHDKFNRRGNVLIADQFNNRVIEVTPAGDIVWSFGLGPNDFSANSIIGCNDSQRVGRFTLMAGTGSLQVRIL